jgi:hypothetical protein
MSNRIEGRLYREDLDDTYVGIGRIDKFDSEVHKLTLIVKDIWWRLADVSLFIQGGTIRFDGFVEDTNLPNRAAVLLEALYYRLEVI